MAHADRAMLLYVPCGLKSYRRTLTLTDPEMQGRSATRYRIVSWII